MARTLLAAAAVLAVCLCVSALPCPSSLQHRRRLQEPVTGSPSFPSAKTPCYYDPTGALAPWLGLCAVNPVWLAAQTPHSKGAKTDVLQARYNLACPKHLPPTPIAEAVAALANGTALPANLTAAINACNADTANSCYVNLNGNDASNAVIECNAYQYAGGVQSKLTCPDTKYTAYLECNGRTRDECTGACAWNAQIFSTVNDNILWRAGFSKVARLFADHSVPILQRAYSCVPSEAANLTGMDFRKFRSEAAASRGNCSYSVAANNRLTYLQTCEGFLANPDVYSQGLMQGYINDTTGETHFDGINATVAEQCLSAGCEIQDLPAGVFGTTEVMFQCWPYEYKRLALGYYDRSRDITLLRAYRQCAAREIQWNATLCQSTVLKAY